MEYDTCDHGIVMGRRGCVGALAIHGKRDRLLPISSLLDAKRSSLAYGGA